MFELIYRPILIIFGVDIPYEHTKRPTEGFFDNDDRSRYLTENIPIIVDIGQDDFRSFFRKSTYFSQ